jgi:hypothetical protein
MPQFGGKDSKRHFTVVMGGKEHGLYVSSTPSSAARKAVTKLCASNKSKKVEFHIREITQGSKKKTYPYSGYIEKLKEPIELKGRVIKYKPVAKLVKKNGAKTAVKKGGMRRGVGNLSNKKGGMNRTGASASSASNNDSKKKVYPRNLHEVKSKEELLSLISLVKFVKKERKKFKSEKPSYTSNNPNLYQASWNDKNNQGFTFVNRDIIKRDFMRKLNEIFKNIPTVKEWEEYQNLGYLINFIFNNEHDELGPYQHKSYFKDIEKYVQKMKKDHPEWAPTENNENYLKNLDIYDSISDNND